jgi:hypothetical protein
MDAATHKPKRNPVNCKAALCCSLLSGVVNVYGYIIRNGDETLIRNMEGNVRVLITNTR